MKPILLAVGVCAGLAGIACDRNANQDESQRSATALARERLVTVEATTTSAEPALNQRRPLPAGVSLVSDTRIAAPDSVPDGNPFNSAADRNGEALGLLSAVNEFEILAADQALAKNVSAPVAEYARMMKKERGANQAKTQALGAQENSREVLGRREKGRGDLAVLGRQTGTAYEDAYVNAMVDAHTDALGLIDGPLLQMSSDGPVREHLEQAREQVARHLEAAIRLQNR